MNSKNENNSIKNDLIVKLKDFHNYKSKSKQLKTISCFLNKKNVVLSTKINYEKNMILYFTFFLNTNSVSLIIYSLNVLKIDQNKIISNINAFVSFCILNDDILIDKLLNQIRLDQHIHVLINFEIAIKNDSFKKIMQFFVFRDKFVLMIINEAHLITD